MTKPNAVITGASGGIGLALARIFAREGYNLYLVARSEDKLRSIASELSNQHGVEATPIISDLTEPDASQAVFDAIGSNPIDVLVNNAGFATYGKFHELDRARELDLIDLNIRALVHLTHLFLPGMLARGSGRIMNVASTAAFMPGPLMANYYASKAYVLSFSHAIANELNGTGVTVTVLAPGPTATDFQSRADMSDSKLVQDDLMSVDEVAEAGYEGLMKGQVVVIPGTLNKIHTLLPRFLPGGFAANMVRNAQAPVGH